MIRLLVDHLWQSTLFAGAVGLLTLLFHHNGAKVRFGLWLAASLKFLIPFSLLAALGTIVAPEEMNATATSLIIQAEPAAEPFTSITSQLDQYPIASSLASTSYITLDDVLLVVWLAGTLVLLALWGVKYIKLKSIARAAQPMDVPASIPVRCSASLMEPGLVGILRPVLLLPRGIEQRLSPAELNAIVSHEVCHARRWDNLTATMHMAVQAAFWFYPMTWWIGQRLVSEREQACDEAVIASGNDPDVYAESILKVCKLYLHSPLDCASGISGADLKKRIEAIIENRFVHRLGKLKKAILAGVAALGVGVPLAAGMVINPDAIDEGRATASPGTEAALRHLVETWEQHRPDFSAITPAMAQVFKRHQVQIQRDIDQSGPLKSITFQKVSAEGWDVYSVAFAKASSTWNVAPLTTDGKIPTLGYWRVFPRNDMTKPSPGTEAALRRLIEGWERHRAATDDMSPAFLSDMKQQVVMTRKIFDEWGALKSVIFARVDANGRDVYDTVFENGRAIFSIGPLTADGKVDSLKVSAAFNRRGTGPNPGTEASLRRYIEALEKGSPDYNHMTPAMAALTRLDLAETLTQFRTWGDLKTLRFRSVAPTGLDVYDTTFEHGHGVWQISPLTNDGRVQWLIFDAI